MEVESKKTTVQLDGKSTANAAVISPKGDIDMHESPKLRTAILAEAAKKPAAVIIDLTGVGFIDSSGVATLVEGLKATKAAGASLILCGMSPKVLDVFELARLDKVFKIVPDLKTLTGE